MQTLLISSGLSAACRCMPERRSAAVSERPFARSSMRSGLHHLQKAPPTQRPSRCRAPVVRAAMAGGASSDDPYKVLGVLPSASSETLLRAYRKRLSENKNDKVKQQQIEEAHSRIMMSNLSARMKGGGNVAKDVMYADKAVYLPWRPRLYLAEQKFIAAVAGIQVLLVAWAVLLSVTAGTQPIIAAATVGFAANAYKQHQIFPPAANPESSSNKNSMGKNVVRGALLAFMATFLGVFLFFTLPDWVAATAGRVLPFWFYEKETMLLSVGAAVMNFVFTSFYR